MNAAVCRALPGSTEPREIFKDVEDIVIMLRISGNSDKISLVDKIKKITANSRRS